jgi:hypothetical protein
VELIKSLVSKVFVVRRMWASSRLVASPMSRAIAASAISVCSLCTSRSSRAAGEVGGGDIVQGGPGAERAKLVELGPDEVLDGLGLGDFEERAQGPEVVVDRRHVHLRRRRQLTQPDRVLSLLGQQLLGRLDQAAPRPAAAFTTAVALLTGIGPGGLSRGHGI